MTTHIAPVAGNEKPVTSSDTNTVLGRVLFRLAHVDRIYIIGCSRSGTTMLHQAMICFENVVISPTETDVWFPYLRDRVKLLTQAPCPPWRLHYVTKRFFGWFMPAHVDAVVEEARLENVGLIHLVRDPRDVMLSKHAGDTRGRDESYVSIEHWYRSIRAADQIFERLKDYPRKLTLRYEDLVRDPLGTEQRISSVFGLRRSPATHSIDRVKDNVDALGIQPDRMYVLALNGVRNMDDRSVGRWKKNPGNFSLSGVDTAVRSRFHSFCEEHGYEPVNAVQ